METPTRTRPVRLTQLVARHRSDILLLAKAHGATNVRIFGSVTKPDAMVHNDLDLLIDLEPGRGLFDRIALIQELGDLLGFSVDVVTESSLHPRIRREVLRSARPL